MIEGIGAAGWRWNGRDRLCITLGRRGRPGEIVAGGALDPRACPGRWNPRRAIPAETDPLSAAAALALEDAGWWRPGQGSPAAGGLVVGIDGANLLSSERFLRAIQGGSAPSPGDFLFSLPSSPAAVLGILFGLADYQATAVGGQDVGLRALRHALDLLELRRVDRVLFAVLSAADGSMLEGPHLKEESADGAGRGAVAWCLNARALEPKYPVRLEIAPAALRLEMRRPGQKNGSFGEPLRSSCELRGLAADAFHDASGWILYTQARGMPPPGS
jgi:hypothetical protein